MRGRKVLVSIVILTVFLLPVCAVFRGQLSVGYDLSFPQTAHLADFSFDCLWGREHGLSGGFVLTLGYGFEHFTRFESNALVYGPELVLGPEIQYAFPGNLSCFLSAEVIACYPLYPQVLRGRVSAGVRLYFGDGFFAGIGTGVLFPQCNAHARLECGVRL
jgi:hypothetical protein